MQQHSTFAHLAAIIADMEMIEAQHASFPVLFAPRAKMFMNQNQFSIKRLAEFRSAVVEKWAKKDGEGRAVLITNPNGAQEISFESEENKTAFTADWNEFMEKSVTLQI